MRFCLAFAIVSIVVQQFAVSAENKTFCLAVSVTDYPHLSYRPLEHSDNVLSQLQKLLIQKAPGKHETIILMGKSSTSTNIREALRTFSKAVQPDDRVIFIFLGHGFTCSIGQDNDVSVIATYDSELSVDTSFITVREIVGRLRNMRCKETLAIFDSCRDFHDDIKVREQNDYQDPDDLARTKSGLIKNGSLFVVQSCELGCVAYERKEGAGLLSHALIDALKEPGLADKDVDGLVNVSEAISYAREKVKSDARYYHRAIQNIHDNQSGIPFVLSSFALPYSNVDSRKPGVKDLTYNSNNLVIGPGNSTWVSKNPSFTKEAAKSAAAVALEYGLQNISNPIVKSTVLNIINSGGRTHFAPPIPPIGPRPPIPFPIPRPRIGR